MTSMRLLSFALVPWSHGTVLVTVLCSANTARDGGARQLLPSIICESNIFITLIIYFESSSLALPSHPCRPLPLATHEYK
jgi:hypothetical protein